MGKFFRNIEKAIYYVLVILLALAALYLLGLIGWPL